MPRRRWWPRFGRNTVGPTVNQDMETATSSISSKRSAQKRATELLDWVIAFLPGATPPSAKDAILDVAEDVDALFYHRSVLQHILAKEPTALDALQLGKLADFDKKIRASALILYASEKGTLQRYRQDRYDHSHWWWYLDDLLQEELMAKRRAKRKGLYPLVSEVNERLLKVAESRAAYGRRTNARKKASK